MADVAPGPSGFPGPGPAPVTPGQGGVGTVTSVGLAMPSTFIVGGSPITGAGSFAVGWSTQAPNTVFSGPVNAPNAAPAFRQIVPADISTAAVTQPWTPTLTFATPGDLAVVYGTRTANYVQFGPLVFFTLLLQVTSITYTTAAGAIQFGGLPVSPTVTNWRWSAQVTGNTVLTAGQQIAGSNWAAASPLLSLVVSTPGTTAGSMTVGNFPTGWAGVIIMSGYFF